ncbi:hypothetical protein L6R52_11505 [Myxococcota bacterium]|nr:hypothetical protein [Myxococcota bacterium]
MPPAFDEIDDRGEDLFEVLEHVLGEESKDHEPLALQNPIAAAVSTITIDVAEVMISVELDDEPELATEEVQLEELAHRRRTPSDVQFEEPGGRCVLVEHGMQEGFGRAACLTSVIEHGPKPSVRLDDACGGLGAPQRGRQLRATLGADRRGVDAARDDHGARVRGESCEDPRELFGPHDHREGKARDGFDEPGRFDERFVRRVRGSIEQREPREEEGSRLIACEELVSDDEVLRLARPLAQRGLGGGRAEERRPEASLASHTIEAISENVPRSRRGLYPGVERFGLDPEQCGRPGAGEPLDECALRERSQDIAAEVRARAPNVDEITACGGSPGA